MISSMTGSWTIPLPFRPILPERLSRTLWNSEMYKRILGVEGGELNAKASRVRALLGQKAFTSVPLPKFRCPRSGLKRRYHNQTR
jgi:hypothetical protein